MAGTLNNFWCIASLENKHKEENKFYCSYGGLGLTLYIREISKGRKMGYLSIYVVYLRQAKSLQISLDSATLISLFTHARQFWKLFTLLSDKTRII